MMSWAVKRRNFSLVINTGLVTLVNSAQFLLTHNTSGLFGAKVWLLTWLSGWFTAILVLILFSEHLKRLLRKVLISGHSKF
jgi:hypothetical protein